MTIELIISLVALVLAMAAMVRSFFNSEKKYISGMEVQKNKIKDYSFEKTNKDNKPEDVFKKTLQSIEDYRK